MDKKNLKIVLPLAVMAALAGWGIFARVQAQADLKGRAGEASMSLVAVRPVIQGPAAETLALPGNSQAISDAPIYARTSGYLKRWHVDIGAKVKAGQLLAEIDTPEVDQQLKQAEADLASSEANEALARSTNERWKGLLATDSVSRQEADEKAGDFATKHQITQAARASLARIRNLRNFQRVVAPFDGTITARNTDVGRLISTGGGAELFHIADTRTLRIYVQVPQAYSALVRAGVQADVSFGGRGDRSWQASVVRTSDALDPATRSLQTELQVDNKDGQLLPGAFAEVHFKLPAAAGSLRVPANALLFRADGLSVATVGADNRVSLKPIKAGRDYGTELEVLSGVSAGDRVVINPPDSLLDKQQVRIAQARAQ
jgi:RND family efflux transporter MFP subunit